jgi:hypothetical protein
MIMIMTMMRGFFRNSTNNKKLLSLGLVLLRLAPTAMGALTSLRSSSHVVEKADEPVKVLLLTEALWYA